MGKGDVQPSQVPQIAHKVDTLGPDRLRNVVAGSVNFQAMRDASGQVMDFGGARLVDVTLDVFNATAYTLTEVDVELDEGSNREKSIGLQIPLSETDSASQPIPSGKVGSIRRQIGILPLGTTWTLKISGAKGYIR